MAWCCRQFELIAHVPSGPNKFPLRSQYAITTRTYKKMPQSFQITTFLRRGGDVITFIWSCQVLGSWSHARYEATWPIMQQRIFRHSSSHGSRLLLIWVMEYWMLIYYNMNWQRWPDSVLVDKCLWLILTGHVLERGHLNWKSIFHMN